MLHHNCFLNFCKLRWFWVNFQDPFQMDIIFYWQALSYNGFLEVRYFQTCLDMDLIPSSLTGKRITKPVVTQFHKTPTQICSSSFIFLLLSFCFLLPQPFICFDILHHHTLQNLCWFTWNRDWAIQWLQYSVKTKANR